MRAWRARYRNKCYQRCGGGGCLSVRARAPATPSVCARVHKQRKSNGHFIVLQTTATATATTTTHERINLPPPKPSPPPFSHTPFTRPLQIRHPTKTASVAKTVYKTHPITDDLSPPPPHRHGSCRVRHSTARLSLTFTISRCRRLGTMKYARVAGALYYRTR